MKKLIGMSLIAVLAMAAEHASAQVYYDTIVKQKDKNGKYKVKIVPSEPAPLIYSSPEVIQMFQDVPYYGYRRYKYYDDQGRKVIMYDDRVPEPNRTYHYYYR